VPDVSAATLPPGSVDAVTVLGDPTRRVVFERLRHGPRSVGELAAGLPVSRPAVSQHLAVLKRARLVSDRKLGVRRLYRIDPTGIDALRRYVDALWTDVLSAYAHAAAEEAGVPEDEQPQQEGR
jgi:DNA-binding transcriptional ArsR family regulator